MKTISYSLVLLLFWLISTNPLFAQWVQTGPYGGEILSLASLPNGSGGKDIFVGTYERGIFMSTDDGLSWEKTTNGILSYSSVSSLVSTYDETGDTDLFAGTYNRVYVTTDRGSTWSLSGLTQGLILALAAVPNDSGGENIFAGSNKHGVFRSTNNGSTWTQVNNGLTDSSIYALTGYIKAHLAGTTVNPDIFAGTYTGGIFLSTNNGSNWTEVDPGLTNTVRSFTVVPNGSEDDIFAGVYNKGVYLSTDDGSNWNPVNNGLTNMSVYALSAYLNGTSGINIVTGTYGSGVFLSTDNGSNWNKVDTNLTNPYVNSLLTSTGQTGNNTIFAGTFESGIFLSTDDGLNWTESNKGLTDVPVTSLVVSHDGSGGTNIFAGASGGISLSTDNGTNWTSVTEYTKIENISALTVTHDSTNHVNIFAAGTNRNLGGSVFRSTDKGASWTAVNSGLTSPHVDALVASDTSIFAGTYDSGIFLSTNNGSSWSQVNNGLTNNDVIALAAYPNDAGGNNILAGTYGGGVFLSTNNGTEWTPVNNGLTDTIVTCLATSSNGTGGVNIFAGLSADGIFRSTNNGTSWNKVNNMYYPQSFAVFDSIIFVGAANGAGIFFSTDNGSSWNDFNDSNTELKRLPIYALTVANDEMGNKYVFAGAYDGGGVWRRPLSDIFTAVKTVPNRLPSKFNLKQNYPNPFNPSTDIKYNIPEAGIVKLTVYNTIGQKVRELVNEFLPAGAHNVRFNASTLSSGIYFYSLEEGGFIQTRKMVLLK